MDTAIREDLAKAYGLTVISASPVEGGWLNRKWRVGTSDGRDLLVKQFSRTRFRPSQLERTVEALRRQQMLRERGVPCPAILPPAGTSDPVRFMDDPDGTVYMVMTWLDGRAEAPETVTLPQLRSLGEVCGRIHRLSAELPGTPETVRGYPIDGAAVIRDLLENHSVRLKDGLIETSEAYRTAVLAQKPIIDALNPRWLDRLPKGIGHEDFSPDNLLFDGDGVAAVLDFDRNQYSFLAHDVGRAILSFALDLDTGELETEKIRAFVEGYATQMPFSMSDVADALRITWCIEVPWWIQPGFFGNCAPKVARFRDEILWLTERYGFRANEVD